jgi:hypothetical protein
MRPAALMSWECALASSNPFTNVFPFDTVLKEDFESRNRAATGDGDQAFKNDRL